MHWKVKVAELPPKYVLLSSDLPVNVCTCRYHQYFMLFCEAMHKIQSDFHLYSHDLPLSTSQRTSKKELTSLHTTDIAR